MSVKRFDISGEHYEVFGDNNGEYCLYEDYAALEQKLAESQREFRAADATIENLKMQVEKLAAERDIVNGDNAYLRDLVICWARECDRITFTHTNKITDAHQTEAEQELANTTPATDAFLAEVRAQGVKSLSNAVQSMISERQRQQSVEGWTPKHDDKHDNNELAFAASCYAFHSAAASWDFEDDGTPYDIHPAPKNWPWAPEWWKPTNPRRDLVKAGALILAEIERIDRQEAAQ